MQQNVIVIGAGIVGISAAIWLQRAGHSVTVIDRVGPAGGTSFGNAGVLAAGAVVPVTVPGIIGKAPRMLFSPDQPLFLKWLYLPKLLPFLLRYLGHANISSVGRISIALNELLHDSRAQHIAPAKGTEAEKFIETEDYLFAYEDEAAFKADSFGWQIRQQRGVKYDQLNADELADHDHNLKGRFGWGIRCFNHGKISDPGAYVAALAAHFESNGGRVVKTDFQRFKLEDGRCVGLQTSTGALTAGKYVLATGVWSGPMAKQLGIPVPLESERGYHVEYINPSISLRSPLMVASDKFVATSMNGRLRCAGVIEFGGLSASASKAAVELIKRRVKKLFPDMTYDRVEEWIGHRPATSDSIPVIGQSPNAENVFVGYGHHHIGLTGGPKTGKWLCELVDSRLANSDIAAFAPNRKV